ncbi:MAG: hypothetical protein OQL06_06555 [Gammaproteobacteria bacterium]|nr:hypothetical protein [Gammaproteobacteria bacterium]
MALTKKKSIVLFVILIAGLFLLYKIIMPGYPDEMTIGVPATGNKQLITTAEKLYTDIFDSIGIKLKITQCSLVNCGTLANKGILDGEIGRDASYNQKFPNLILVNASLASINITAYTANENIKLGNSSELGNSAYRLAYISGNHKTKTLLSSLVPEQQLVKVTDWKQGLNTLLQNQADIYIGLEPSISEALASSQFNQSKIRKLFTLYRIPLYTFIHKKHAIIKKDLEAAIRKARKSETTRALLGEHNLNADN